ncbi:MAG: DUF6226 family protein [Propionibacteriaceae bacterium]|nr:DUF6226 family protein [Propionibacteriaceae bacterium]
MLQYQRPPIELGIYHDAEGAVIPYGHRWGGVPAGQGLELSSAPRDVYSVVTHPERFEPVVTVAEALIDYLGKAYDVEIREGLDLLPQLFPRWADMSGDEATPDRPRPVRVVQVVPRSDASLPLAFLFTSVPGVSLRAGFFSETVFPDCGCDACDDDVLEVCTMLEQAVFAAISGGLTESIDWRRVTEEWTFPDGGRSSGHLARDLDPRARTAYKAFRKRHRGGPQPWAARLTEETR